MSTVSQRHVKTFLFIKIYIKLLNKIINKIVMRKMLFG